MRFLFELAFYLEEGKTIKRLEADIKPKSNALNVSIEENFKIKQKVGLTLRMAIMWIYVKGPRWRSLVMLALGF